jgi:hypothetical protein
MSEDMPAPDMTAIFVLFYFLQVKRIWPTCESFLEAQDDLRSSAAVRRWGGSREHERAVRQVLRR